MKELTNIIKNYKCLCFLDLEGTQFSHEMIAIGAILVTCNKKNEIKISKKHYYTLVKSKNKVGPVVTKLTNITDEMLKKSGIPFRKAMEGLKKYLGLNVNKTLFITYGNHDLRIINQSLQYNMDANNELAKVILAHYLNFEEFAAKYIRDENNNILSVTNLLKVFNIEFQGEKHNALADTYNLIMIFQAFLQEKDIVFSRYKQALKQNKHLPSPLLNVIKDLSEGKAVTPTIFDKYIYEAIK